MMVHDRPTPDAQLPPLPGVEHHFAALNGITLHFAQYGEANGRDPVILLHGFPELWYAWHRVMALLGPQHQVVAPDLRGYGRSDKPQRVAQYTADIVVDDIRALADHLGADRIVLVGHDWGGVIAWEFAARYPDRISKLVIVNAPHPSAMCRELRRSPRQLLASSYVALFLAPFAEAVLRAFHYALLDGPVQRGLRHGYFDARDAAVYRAAWRAPGALFGGLAYYRALGSERATAPRRSTRVTAPTLVIWGMRDRYLLPGLLEGLDRWVPQLRIERAPAASHWIIHEQPALVAAAIDQFAKGG